MILWLAPQLASCEFQATGTPSGSPQTKDRKIERKTRSRNKYFRRAICNCGVPGSSVAKCGGLQIQAPACLNSPGNLHKLRVDLHEKICAARGCASPMHLYRPVRSNDFVVEEKESAREQQTDQEGDHERDTPRRLHPLKPAAYMGATMLFVFS